VGILGAAEAAAVTSELRNWLDPVRKSLAAGDNKRALQCLLPPLAGKLKLPTWFVSMANENLDALKRQFFSKLPPPSISCEELRRYPRSMLVLQGENSPRAFQIVNAAFRRCARNAQLETIKRCGHIFQIDAPGKRWSELCISSTPSPMKSLEGIQSGNAPDNEALMS